MTSPRTCRIREKPPEVNERTLAETSEIFARRPEALVAYLFGSHARVYSILTQALTDLEEFARHIQAWLDGKT